MTNANMTNARRDKLLKRLNLYWKLEASNILLVPAMAFGLVLFAKAQLSISMFITAAATSFLLWIGTIAWYIVFHELNNNPKPKQKWIPTLAKLQWPSLALVVVAIISVFCEAFKILPSTSSNASLIAASILAVLALLEYINYYHFQLQHFDHAPDFLRLISGRGFRKSHLAKQIAAFRQTKPQR
jgi:arginine exporter protein ArgO